MLRSLFGINWRQSKPHLELLSKFLDPCWAKSIEDTAIWRDVLTEKPADAIKRFQKEGLLVVGSLEDHLIAKCTAKELKALAKASALPVSGRKEEIAHRLAEKDPSGAKSVVKGVIVLRCSQTGAAIAEAYVAGENQRRNMAEERSLAFVVKGKLADASTTVASYEAERVFPRGMGIDWQHHDPSHDVARLAAILKAHPKILGTLSDSQLASLRQAACMMALFGVGDADHWLPPELKTGLPFDNNVAARMILFYGQHQATLREYQHIDSIIGVQILAAASSCDACRKLDRTKHFFGSVPELPNEHCTHPMGCRCTYIAIVRGYEPTT